MHVQEINSNYIFTDGEIIYFKVDYQVATEEGLTAAAEVAVKAKRTLANNDFEYCTLVLNFTGITWLFISEDFSNQSKISDMTLKRLEDGLFYVSLHPFNTSNEPDEKDNFVIKAQSFTFDMLKK